MYLPIQIVVRFFKMGENGHRTVETQELLLGDRRKAAILHGTGKKMENNLHKYVKHVKFMMYIL